MEDKRFSHVATDPKFRRIPKGERKVKIDKRFQSMFNDKRFKVKYTTDKRGRPVNHTSSEDLRRYYELSSEDSSEESDEQETPGKYVKAPKSEEDEAKIKPIEPQISDEIKSKLKNLNVDYARGEGKLQSESSSDEETEDEESDTDDVEHKWGELDADADRTEEATYRLAACNMDWDRIRAIDLMVLFNSFLSQTNIIKSVVIYPSEFGLQRMKDEEIKGPSELVETKLEETENEETEEGSKYHMEKLRQYQLNRLKYYYAVITCDSIATANKIYTECDGLEYESSATKIDLRFIPDVMTFDAEPKEICDKLPDMGKYQPRFFTTTALQQAKVDLTWDETTPERVEITQKLATGKIDDISETDLQAYLASSSEEEEAEEGIGEDESNKSDGENDNVNQIDKYRALLNEIEVKEKEKENRGVEMEVSWGIDLKEKTEALVKKKLETQENKTPFQQYLDKRKDKLKQKREERKKHESDSEDSDLPSDIDLKDSYFAEEFDKPEFKQSKKQSKKIEVVEDKQKEAELELLLSNDDESKKHFSLKKIQKQENDAKSKKNRKKNRDDEKIEDNFELKVNDERFSALFTSHHFNIDPTDPHFKKTKGIEKLINEKLKRRNTNDNEEVSSKKVKIDNKRNAELSVLVKSVKRKTQALENKAK